MEDIINEIKNGSIGSYLDLSGIVYVSGVVDPKIKTKEELILIFEELYLNNSITSIDLSSN